MIFEVITALFLIMLGLLVRIKKPSFLIPSPNLVAGANKVSKEEMKEYDLDALCKFVSNMLFIIACLYLVLALSSALELRVIKLFIYPIIWVYVSTCVIYANISNRFRKEYK